MEAKMVVVKFLFAPFHETASVSSPISARQSKQSFVRYLPVRHIRRRRTGGLLIKRYHLSVTGDKHSFDFSQASFREKIEDNMSPSGG